MHSNCFAPADTMGVDMADVDVAARDLAVRFAEASRVVARAQAVQARVLARFAESSTSRSPLSRWRV
jgi:hypothetical protein